MGSSLLLPTRACSEPFFRSSIVSELESQAHNSQCSHHTLPNFQHKENIIFLYLLTKQIDEKNIILRSSIVLRSVIIIHSVEKNLDKKIFILICYFLLHYHLSYTLRVHRFHNNSISYIIKFNASNFIMLTL